MVAPCYDRRLLYLETVLERGGYDTRSSSLVFFWPAVLRVLPHSRLFCFNCLLLVVAPSTSPVLRTHVFLFLFLFLPSIVAFFSLL